MVWRPTSPSLPILSRCTGVKCVESALSKRTTYEDLATASLTIFTLDRFSHPTPWHERSEMTGTFPLPAWQMPFHPHMGAHMTLWRDPTRPAENIPVRNVDGNIAWRSQRPGQWHGLPPSRPVLHRCAWSDEFEDLDESDDSERSQRLKDNLYVSGNC